MNWIIGAFAPALAPVLVPALAPALAPVIAYQLERVPILWAQPAPIEPFTLTAELTRRDRRLPDGSYAKLHPLNGIAGQQVTIDVISNDFDAFVLLVGPNERVIGQDDDSGEGRHARLTSILTITGTYQIVVNTARPGEIGRYTLTVGPASDAMEVAALPSAASARE
ncbi:MAG: hypothetical protein AAF152_16760 [Cyanobacteria bacterium P01_A01_bin.114]